MKRLSCTVIALGLAAAVGTASAQVAPAVDTRGYPAYGDSQPQYEYARVINVVRVPGGGYAANTYGSQGQRCYTRDEGYVDRYGNTYGGGYPGGYNDGYNRGYGNNGYDNRGYGNSGYGGGSQTGRTVATVVGGVVGAVLGSQVGGGSARYATSAIGSMVGSQVGGSIYDQSRRERQRGQVTVCDPVPAGGSYGNAGYGNARYGNGGYDAYDVTYEYNGRRYTSRMNHDPGQRVRVRVDVTPE